MQYYSYKESSRPSFTGIIGPSHSATAAAPATAIKSAQDTAKILPIFQHLQLNQAGDILLLHHLNL